MDPVFLWKEISIVATGFFGVLALLTEFKDKDTRRVTAWGRVSLTGILLSTIFGALAQYKEVSDNEAASRGASEATLKIVTNTSAAVSDIERLFSRIDEPTISMIFVLPCEDPKLVEFCGALQFLPLGASNFDHTIWKKWPFRKYNDAVHFGVHVAIFTPERAKSFRAGKLPPDDNGDLEFTVATSSEPGSAELIALASSQGKAFLTFSNVRPIIKSSGKLVSIGDLAGTTAFIDPALLDVLPIPTAFTLITKYGQSVSSQVDHATSDPFDHLMVVDRRFWAYSFK